MNILVTNDDGIFAPGVSMLVEVLQHFGDVYIVCPDKEQSAVSHSITLRRPLKARAVHIFPGAKGAWAVNGTPADCIKLGLDVLLDAEPDIVFSGLNAGPNIGRDCYYSGTMAGAAEASLYGVRAVSMSLNAFQESEMKESQVRPLIYDVVRTISQHKIPKGMFLNINFPNLPKHQCEGVAVVPLDMAVSRYRHAGFHDPHGNAFHWLKDEWIKVEHAKEDSDFSKLKQGYVTVSPVEFRQAQTRKREQIEKWFQEVPTIQKEETTHA
ncbi:5'/3'-nucleotidase SurE [Virgibacillus xinjiangensis]|uniref:5'-nucleotidase SurE n=1 Tax=Virgibacillus xinjiangensis TaxID=393090 RepID=A0ABV7CWK6_9BACI